MTDPTPPRKPVSRREWFGRVAVGLGLAFGVSPREAPGQGRAISPTLRSADAGRDPRLTARPFAPRVNAEAGVHRFGEQLDRDGFLYVPQGYEPSVPAPFIVALHGGGGDADRWESLFPACDTHGIVLLAPDSRGRTWDRVHGEFGPDVGFIDSALRFAFDRCHVDFERLALAGFSDGASYALSLGVSNGDLFTHLIAWSPGFTNPTDPIVGRPSVFVSHGTGDRVLPVEASREGIVPIFEMDGYDTHFVQFDGLHEIPSEVLDRTLDWFLDA